MNNNKLKGKLKEFRLTYKSASEKLNIGYSTFKNKINGNSFTTKEAAKLTKILNLSDNEAVEIFLN